MKQLLLLACLFMAHSLFGYTYTGNYCCNSSNTSFNTTTCTSTGGDSKVGSISCTVTVGANQTVFAFGFYGIAFTPTPTPTSTSCGITWQPGGRANMGINGIAAYPWADVGDTGSFSGACTITMAPAVGPDFMYIQVLVYDTGINPVQDPGGVLVGSGGSTSTDSINTYPPTTYSNEALLCVHGWGGATSTAVTLSGGAGETVRFNNSQAFTILGSNKEGLIIEDSLSGPPGNVLSVASATAVPTGGWLQIMIPVRTSASATSLTGEPRRRIVN